MHRLSAYVIVHRTQSNQTADGNRSDGGRNPIRQRTETDWTANANGRGCSCLSCTNQANWQSIAAGSARLCRLPEQELHQPSNKANDTNVGGYGIPAVVTQSLNTNILPLIADLQQIIMVRKNNNGFIGLNGFAGCVESVAILRIQNPHIP